MHVHKSLAEEEDIGSKVEEEIKGS